MAIRVYLAGPDVFLPDPHQRAAAMKRICAQYGLQGVSPLDPLPGEPGADAFSIARRNEAHIRGCDAILANLSPFRGPGADAGTVYEVGFGRALGLPVFGFATVAAGYASRVRTASGEGKHDADGLAIEDFGLFENLMISCGIVESGGFMLAEDAAAGWQDLGVFERCVGRAAAVLSRRDPCRSRTPPAIPLQAAPAG